MRLTVGHDVGAGELLPGLDGGTGEGALPHAVLEKLVEPVALGLALKAQSLGDFLPLGNDERVFLVTASMDPGKNVYCFLL